MKKIMLFLIAFVAIGAIVQAERAFAELSEKEAVKIPLKNYLKGHALGKSEYMQKAFHTDGQLIFIRDGKYSTIEFKDFVSRVNRGPAKDEAMRKRWIESIDIAGNAATGKIILDYPNVRFTDYMALLKINGEWKIVNKTFYAERKKKE